MEKYCCVRCPNCGRYQAKVVRSENPSFKCLSCGKNSKMFGKKPLEVRDMTSGGQAALMVAKLNEEHGACY